MAKLEETDAKVSEIQRKLNGNCSGQTSLTPPANEAPLFSEFTSRGVLSALKDIEVKVNKIADKTLNAPKAVVSHSTPTGSSVSKGREDLQQKTLDVVNDVAGKVDFILDKMVVKRHSNGGGGKQVADEPVEEGGVMYDDDTDYSPNGDGGGTSQAERTFVKLWRRMLQPVRRANRKFESLDRVLAQLDRVANVTMLSQQRRLDDIKPIRDDLASLLDCCRGNDVGLRALTKAIESLAGRPQPSCVAEADLLMRLQETQASVIRQLSVFVKDQVSAGVEHIGYTCGSMQQRKKLSSAHQNGTVTDRRFVFDR